MAQSLRAIYFNPRPPWGGRLGAVRELSDSKRISIHALRGEGDGFPIFYLCLKGSISIHALRGEGDVKNMTCKDCIHNISIHALRGEGDRVRSNVYPYHVYFNPRPPWGGRPLRRKSRTINSYFNPRPPWGGRQTHTRRRRCKAQFQSTPSVGRATLRIQAIAQG